MQKQDSTQKQEIIQIPPCMGKIRHETQLAPVEMDPLYEKAFYSQGEDWTREYALNTTAWD